MLKSKVALCKGSALWSQGPPYIRNHFKRVKNTLYFWPSKKDCSNKAAFTRNSKLSYHSGQLAQWWLCSSKLEFLVVHCDDTSSNVAEAFCSSAEHKERKVHSRLIFRIQRLSFTKLCIIRLYLPIMLLQRYIFTAGPLDITTQPTS